MNDNVDPRTGVHRVRKKRAKSSIIQQTSHEESSPLQEQQHEQQADSPTQMTMAFGPTVDMPFTIFNPNEAQMSQAVMQDMKRREEHEHGHYE